MFWMMGEIGFSLAQIEFGFTPLLLQSELIQKVLNLFSESKLWIGLLKAQAQETKGPHAESGIFSSSYYFFK